MNDSILQLLGLPQPFGVTLLGLGLIVTLAPYIGGSDFGLFKVPAFSPNVHGRLRVLGPLLLFGAVALHMPLVAKSQKTLMGPLQHGVNFDHHDINPDGWVQVASAEACSDLCHRNDDCKAMTYVISNKTCWLKFDVPQGISNPDMISAVRR